ncbi:MAG: SpoIID/LytB domain-containing protein [Breznakibacter sp.]
MKSIPHIQVGILSATTIRFEMEKTFAGHNGILLDKGIYTAFVQDGNVVIESAGKKWSGGESIVLQRANGQQGVFKLCHVVIGVDFHWQRHEDQLFVGQLKLMCDGEKLWAINIVPVEAYLESVISSEMSATSSLELLKAHAVISRSWLLAQIDKNKQLGQSAQKYQTWFESETERVKWYDREDHVLFDVCADDHCQRYQGITKASAMAVKQAVDDTKGQILVSDGKICDARFSKCCGGMTELFPNAWEPVDHPYLQPIIDNDGSSRGFDLDLTRENDARTWILGNPPAFCNTQDKKVLHQVLNDFDRETNDFYRWTVVYTQDEVSRLVSSRTGIDFGTVTDLIPVERGASGRLIKLKIIGSKRTMTIGKELEIRKALSKSHLYSSAFVIEKSSKRDQPEFILYGAGWGHGVGLCQIGAAVMGDQGYGYRQILSHYFVGAMLETAY